MKRPLIFVGSRTMMADLACIAENNDIEILGILDHHYYGNTESIGNIPVIGDERWLLDPTNAQAQQYLKTCNFFPGNWHNGEQKGKSQLSLPELRLQRIKVLEDSGANVVNLIHPSASIPRSNSKYASFNLGRGVLISDGVAISNDRVSIGNYSAFLVNTCISHDVTIGNNVLVSINSLLYDCTIGDNSYIGISSRVNPFQNRGPVYIGKNATIWHHSDVGRNVPDDHYYTNTNRILKKR